MTNTTLLGIAAVPAILGITQAAKQAGMPSRLAPLAALALGLLAGIGEALAGHLDWASAIAAGTALGLSASGLYSGASAVAAGGEETTTTTAITNTDPFAGITAQPTPGPIRSNPAPADVAKPRRVRSQPRSTGGKFISPVTTTPPPGTPPTT
jgi:hypothetical protein